MLADNNDVTRFLNDFARRRTDIFGDDEYGVSILFVLFWYQEFLDSHLKAQIGRSETQDTETPPDAIWDGHRGTAQKVRSS